MSIDQFGQFRRKSKKQRSTSRRSHQPTGGNADAGSNFVTNNTTDNRQQESLSETIDTQPTTVIAENRTQFSTIRYLKGVFSPTNNRENIRLFLFILYWVAFLADRIYTIYLQYDFYDSFVGEPAVIFFIREFFSDLFPTFLLVVFVYFIVVEKGSIVLDSYPILSFILFGILIFLWNM